VETETGTMLYTGDFKLRRSLTSEQAVSVQADTLVMECTFGLPRYRFPSAEQTHGQIIDFCHACLGSGCLPVLLAYSIGKAQELLALMRLAGLAAALHTAVHKMALVYEAHGVAFADFTEWDGENHEGRVMIFPPNVRDQLAHIPHARYAIASGWAMDKGAIYRYRCDAAFPLSDHADYDELLEHVALVRPKRVFAVHGFVEEFARDLRRLGIDALALGGKNQLELVF
jgi:Cft2 family RNA processing exonuclease